MARPTIDLPYWAVQDVTLAVAGTTNKIKPKTSLQQYGWDKKEQPSCQELNWYFNAVYQWIAYLDTATNSATSEATANTVVLRDSAAGFKAGTIQATSLITNSLKNIGSTTTYGAIINYGTITNSGKETHTGAQVFSSTISSTGVNTFSGVNTFNNTSNVFYGTLTGDVTGTLTGNASTATKLKNTFGLIFTGAATGSANIDGSEDVVVALTSSDDWTNSQTTNGYTYLPNGIIMQWGFIPSIAAATSTTISFPVKFPNTCLNATLSSNTANQYVWISGFSAAVLTVDNSSGTSSCSAYWFAVGH